MEMFCSVSEVIIATNFSGARTFFLLS